MYIDGRLFWLLPLLIMGVGVLPMPYDYYMFSRLVVSLSFVAYTYRALQLRRHNGLILTFIAFAILYNPIDPIELGDKATWLVVNLVTGMLLFYYRPLVEGNAKGTKTSNSTSIKNQIDNLLTEDDSHILQKAEERLQLKKRTQEWEISPVVEKSLKAENTIAKKIIADAKIEQINMASKSDDTGPKFNLVDYKSDIVIVALILVAILSMLIGLVEIADKFDEAINGQALEYYRKLSTISSAAGKELQILLFVIFQHGSSSAIGVLMILSSCGIFLRKHKSQYVLASLWIMFLLITPLNQVILNTLLNQDFFYGLNKASNGRSWIIFAVIFLILTYPKSVKAHLNRPSYNVVRKAFVALVVSFFTISVGVFLASANNGLKLDSILNEGNSKALTAEPNQRKKADGSLDISGVWEIKSLFSNASTTSDLVGQTIQIYDDLIYQSDVVCRILATEVQEANALIETFHLKGDFGPSPKVKKLTTNCNDAGNPFVKSDGFQSIFVLNETFLLVYFKSAGDIMLAHLSQNNSEQTYSKKFQERISALGR